VIGVYVLRRLLQMVPTFLLATLLSFVLIQAAPGNFVDRFAMETNVDPGQLERLNERLGLDQPVIVQYGRWMWSLVRYGYLGESFDYRAPVAGVILPMIANSMSLALVALVLTYLLAVPLAVTSAVRKYSLTDKAVTAFSFFGLAIPNFFFILLLIVGVIALQPQLRALGASAPWLDAFVYDLQRGLLFPVGGMRTTSIYDGLSAWGKLVDRGWHLALPVLVVTTSSLAPLVRVLRGQMLEILESDYVRTARAKGLPLRGVVYKHALRNALNPLLSSAGAILPELITGAGLVEFVIRWPGITPAFVAAIQAQDVYVIMGLLTLSVLLLMIGNLIADFLLVLVDPRIRYT
jgi:peptide/nickel transport system permease protein